jgi:hypothetical protein
MSHQERGAAPGRRTRSGVVVKSSHASGSVLAFRRVFCSRNSDHSRPPAPWNHYSLHPNALGYAKEASDLEARLGL